MKYVIRRHEPLANRRAAYVNQPGSHKSYTQSKDRARKFASYEEAKLNCCGNESPEPA